MPAENIPDPWNQFVLLGQGGRSGEVRRGGGAVGGVEEREGGGKESGWVGNGGGRRGSGEVRRVGKGNGGAVGR